MEIAKLKDDNARTLDIFQIAETKFIASPEKKVISSKDRFL